MALSKRNIVAFAFATLVVLPTAALADPAPAPSAVPSAAPTSPQALASPLPKASGLPPNIAVTATGTGGFSEGHAAEGLSIGASVKVENTQSGAYIELGGTLGSPLVRVQGHAELIPVRIVKTEHQLSNG